MSDDRVRRRAAVKPLKWIGKGVSRGARGVWRVVRRRRRDRALPMASLTATLVDSRLAASSDISSDWSGYERGEEFTLFQLPQLQLPSWLTAAVDSWALNHSSSSSSRVYTDCSSSSSRTRSSMIGINAHPMEIQVADRLSGSSSSSLEAANKSSSVQVLAQMLNTDNTFPMVLQPIGSSSSSSIGSSKLRSTQHDRLSAYSDTLYPSHHHQQQQEEEEDDSYPGSGSSSSGQQQLLTVGTRHWGNWWDGRGLLKVKIYDFAVYVDGQQVGHLLPATSSGTAGNHHQQQQQQQLDLPAQIKSHSSGVGMSLILKAAREVPLHMLQDEYEKVLARRLVRAEGDDSDSAALKKLLSGLGDPQRLPAAVRCGHDDSSVAKGAMIVFERSGNGEVTARIGPHVLDTVRSPKLSEALFDLYLGDQPVSKTAKEAAAESLQHMAQQQQHKPYYLPRGSKEEIRCDGFPGFNQSSDLVRRSAAKQDLGLSVSDLAACVLHMGH